MTMVKDRKTKVPPPPSKTHVRRLQVTAPTPAVTPNNLSRSTHKIVDLNFKVEDDFHRRYKMIAMLKGMTMKELLESSLSCYLDQFGTPDLPKDLFHHERHHNER